MAPSPPRRPTSEGPRPPEVVVRSSLNLAEAHLVRSVLTREGLPSTLRRQHLAPLFGALPGDDARVEVVVLAEHAEVALSILAEALRPAAPDRDCPRCGEPNPGNFELCWGCGAALPTLPLRLV